MNQAFDIWKLLAGVGIFLFGMQFLESALKNIAGRKFKKFLREQTTNPLKGIFAGTFVTMILQSSSVVTLMLLAFVGAGILSLQNAIGVVIGANLGTTFTGWIVATLGFKANIESFSLPFIALGCFGFLFFSSRPKLYEWSKFLIGFGFVFLGLEYMKDAVAVLSQTVDLQSYNLNSKYNYFIFGFFLTAIIQSSSASMVITLSALSSGLITLPMAAAIVVGSDLGTTITVIIGALKGNALKKQVAAGHFIFNLLSDLLAIIFLEQILTSVQSITGVQDPLFSLVLFHSSFNLLGIIVFLPFVSRYARFLQNVFKEDSEALCAYLVNIPFKETDEAIRAGRLEILRLLKKTLVFLNELTGAKTKGLTAGITNFTKNYLELKKYYAEILEYLLRAQQSVLTAVQSEAIGNLLKSLDLVILSAKSFKDIKHNIEDFDRADSESVQSWIRLFRAEQNEFLESYLVKLNTVDVEGRGAVGETIEENLELTIGKFRNNYSNLINKIHELIRADAIDELTAASLLMIYEESQRGIESLLLALPIIQKN